MGRKSRRNRERRRQMELETKRAQDQLYMKYLERLRARGDEFFSNLAATGGWESSTSFDLDAEELLTDLDDEGMLEEMIYKWASDEGETPAEEPTEVKDSTVHTTDDKTPGMSSRQDEGEPRESKAHRGAESSRLEVEGADYARPLTRPPKPGIDVGLPYMVHSQEDEHRESTPPYYNDCRSASVRAAHADVGVYAQFLDEVIVTRSGARQTLRIPVHLDLDEQHLDVYEDVKISGDGSTVVVRAFNRKETSELLVYRYRDGAYLFETNLSSAHGKDISGGVRIRVSFNGNVIVETNGKGGTENAAVALYEYHGDAWTHSFVFRAIKAVSDVTMGSAVALSGDGLRLFIHVELQAENNNTPVCVFAYRRVKRGWMLYSDARLKGDIARKHPYIARCSHLDCSYDGTELVAYSVGEPCGAPDLRMGALYWVFEPGAHKYVYMGHVLGMELGSECVDRADSYMYALADSGRLKAVPDAKAMNRRKESINRSVYLLPAEQYKSIAEDVRAEQNAARCRFRPQEFKMLNKGNHTVLVRSNKDLAI